MTQDTDQTQARLDATAKYLRGRTRTKWVVVMLAVIVLGGAAIELTEGSSGRNVRSGLYLLCGVSALLERNRLRALRLRCEALGPMTVGAMRL